MSSVPNTLTIIRIGLVPLFVAAFFLPGELGRWIVFVLFCLAGAEAYGDVPQPSGNPLGDALDAVLRAVVAGVLVGKPGGRLLNHSITRPDNRFRSTGAFIDRYIFPDGELIGSGRIIAEAQDAGFEVRHEENLREHYALTLAGWCRNLADHWDECVDEVGAGIARVWGLYMAGSRLAFECNEIQLHQVLAVRVGEGVDPL